MDNPKLLDDHFYKFFQCPHWIWYDIYGDATQKKDVPPLLELIYKGKATNAKITLGNHKKFEEIPQESARDLDEAFLATLNLMKEGNNIYRGVLMDENWVGMPDLLEARPIMDGRKSKLGNWEYVVYDVQTTLDLRDEFKFQLVFYSLILERIQGIRPKEAYFIDPQGITRSFLVDDFIDQFHATREQIEKILNGEKPAPFLKSTCKRTPWYSLCLSGAQECNDVSLVFRLSQADQRQLYGIGIRTVEDLAKADLNFLESKLTDWPYDKLIRLYNQARSLSSQEVTILKKAEFPKVAAEIYFDVESDPISGIDYLLGALVKQNGTDLGYKSFLAKDAQEEEKMWKDFLDFLASFDEFVIYHFAYFERQVFERLAKKYGAPEILVSKFNDNTIDLHLKMVESVVLPLYFYTLKDVGKYLGYNWHDPNAGGAESVMWFGEWLKEKDPKILKKLLRYNEDDVRATMVIKEWLEKQKPRAVSRERLPE